MTPSKTDGELKFAQRSMKFAELDGPAEDAGIAGDCLVHSAHVYEYSERRLPEASCSDEYQPQMLDAIERGAFVDEWTRRRQFPGRGSS
jgi:hypothetical protein